MACELPLYRRHARRTLLAQDERSAFAMYRRQVEILRDRIRARKRNPSLYTATDFERQLHAVREFRRRFEALAQARASLDRIAAIEAQTLYFGHGDPWSGGAAAAVAEARARDKGAG